MQLLCASGYARQTMYVYGERVHIISIFTYVHSTTVEQSLVFTRPLSLHANGQFKNTLSLCTADRVLFLSVIITLIIILK